MMGRFGGAILSLDIFSRRPHALKGLVVDRVIGRQAARPDHLHCTFAGAESRWGMPFEKPEFGKRPKVFAKDAGIRSVAADGA